MTDICMKRLLEDEELIEKRLQAIEARLYNLELLNEQIKKLDQRLRSLDNEVGYHHGYKRPNGY